MPLEDSSTAENLREAFAREAQSHLRSLYFARRADLEGNAEAAVLLRSLAEGESGHGFGHLEFLEDIADPLSGGGDTAGNLDSAVAEAEANAAAYSAYAETARKEKLIDAAEWFESVSSAETAHAAQLRALRGSLDRKR